MGAIFLAILSAFSLGLFMTIKALQTEYYDIIYYGIGIFCMGLLYIFELSGLRFFQETVKVIGLFFFLIFCKKSFYNEKSPTVFTLLYIYHFILLFINPILSLNYDRFAIIINLFFGSSLMFIFLLISIGAWVDYKKIKVLNVEPFLKIRYLLVSMASFLFIITGSSIIIGHIFRKYGSDNIYNVTELITIFSALLASIVFYLAFVGPKKFRKIFNRTYKSIDIDYNGFIEQEIIGDLLDK